MRMRARSTAAGVILLSVALLAAGCSSSSAPSSSATTTSATTTSATSATGTRALRPNIVFILTDDLSWNLVTKQFAPHIVQLQQQGATFDHYFVTDSLCCPSRSS